MECLDKRFTSREISLLRRVKGARLISMDAVLIASNRAWNAVRLHFEDFDIDIRVHLEDVAYDDSGSVDEYGLMSIDESSSDVLAMSEICEDATVYDIDKVIISVHVVDDTGEVYENGILVSRVVYPQAIAFRCEDGFIVLDNGAWFSELIDIGMYKDAIEKTIYDESFSWEDEPDQAPTIHLAFKTETREL
jgi:hypothetical protein